MSEQTKQTEQTDSKLVVFLDAIGRTILGELYTDPDKPNDPATLPVKNPVVLHVVPDTAGRMSVQLLPVFFREFLADREDDAVFEFKSSNITISKITTLDFRLQSQYGQLFGKDNIFVPPTRNIVTPDAAATPSTVVNLFDSE